MKKTLVQILLFAGLLFGNLHANDTIRWTWNVSYDRTCGFYMSGTEGGEFLVDWGDGTTEAITGEYDWYGYGSYISHEYKKGDYTVRLYALTAESNITYLNTSFNSYSSSSSETQRYSAEYIL